MIACCQRRNPERFAYLLAFIAALLLSFTSFVFSLWSQHPLYIPSKYIEQKLITWQKFHNKLFRAWKQKSWPQSSLAFLNKLWCKIFWTPSKVIADVCGISSCCILHDFRGVPNGTPLSTNRIFDLLAIICSLLTSGRFGPLNFILVLQTSDSKWCWAIIVKFRVWFTYIATRLQVIMILSNFTVNYCDSLLRAWMIN